MNWSDFFIKVFGNSSSKEELELLGSWKQESKASVDKLQEFARSTDTGRVDLTAYKQYNVEEALQQSLDQISTHRRNRMIMYSIGAFLVLALLAVGFSWNNVSGTAVDNTSVIKTIIAENGNYLQERADGTIITYTPEAVMTFVQSDNSYRVEGAAFFDVSKQEKPLQILTAQGNILVVGTAFDVLTESDNTTVSMLEGVVTFIGLVGKEYRVEAGQVLLASASGIKVVTPENAQVYSYWRTNRLQYDSESLANVLNDLSRLYKKPVPVVSNDQGKIKVSVVFQDSNYDDMLVELSTITGISFLD